MGQAESSSTEPNASEPQTCRISALCVAPVPHHEDHPGRPRLHREAEGNQAGMQQKTAEFRQRGGEVSLPADSVVGADAGETVAADRWPRRVHRNTGSTGRCSPRRAL